MQAFSTEPSAPEMALCQSFGLQIRCAFSQAGFAGEVGQLLLEQLLRPFIENLGAELRGPARRAGNTEVYCEAARKNLGQTGPGRF